MIEQKIPCRNLCQICGNLCYVDFWVPNEIWYEAVRNCYVGGPVCLHCFCVRADDKNLEWDKEIKFYPTSAVTQRKFQTVVVDGDPIV